MCTLEPSMSNKGLDTSMCQKCKRNFYKLKDSEIEDRLIEFGIFVPYVTKEGTVIDCNGYTTTEGELHEHCKHC